MHETSLGLTIQDYLTGEQITATTYEDLRQALARLLVEEKGFPKPRLKPKRKISFVIDDQDFSRIVDLTAYDEQDRPLMVLIFCPGNVESFTREAVAAARLTEPSPAPIVVVTDTMDARLLSAADGKVLALGFHAIPHWNELKGLAQKHAIKPLTPERKQKEQRILYAYTELGGGCCRGECET